MDEPEQHTPEASSGLRAPPPRIAAICALALAIFAFVLSLSFTAQNGLTGFFLDRQDRWLLLGEAAMLLGAMVALRGRTARLEASARLPLIAAGGLVLFCLAGHFWILSGYDMSRDEQMATFDAAVFASGRLVQPLPALWRDHGDALNTMFMYPAAERGAWISSYLPLNAVLRALLGIVTTPALAGPAMTGIGALALWGCARRIWPTDREAAVVALLLYLGSAQVLFIGMTAYAMPAHLALNLVWLWLFLRRTGWSDLAALAVGFMATGLHQPLMHPMFAAPLLFAVVRERAWRRAALFAVGYVLIGAFWLWWPTWTWTLVQASAAPPRPEGVDYLTRLIATVRDGGDLRLALMAANVLRFVAWQHLLLAPLLIVGLRVCRRHKLAGDLAMGVLLTTLTMAIILPYQGHGFGYRYLHGLIGNCVLLAVFGWRHLGEELPRWRALLVRTSLAGLALLLPLQGWMAHAFYAPAALASARIGAAPADYALIGASDAPFAADLIYNPPALDRRPIRLLREAIDPAFARTLCAGHPAVVLAGDGVLQPIRDYFGDGTGHPAAKDSAAAAAMLAVAGCRISSLD